MDVEQGGERQGPGWGSEWGHDVALKARKAFLSPSEPRAFSVGTHCMVLPPSDLAWGTIKILNSWLSGTLTCWAHPALPGVAASCWVVRGSPRYQGGAGVSSAQKLFPRQVASWSRLSPPPARSTNPAHSPSLLWPLLSPPPGVDAPLVLQAPPGSQEAAPVEGMARRPRLDPPFPAHRQLQPGLCHHPEAQRLPPAGQPAHRPAHHPQGPAAAPPAA